jgi:hypothetical protein
MPKLASLTVNGCAHTTSRQRLTSQRDGTVCHVCDTLNLCALTSTAISASAMAAAQSSNSRISTNGYSKLQCGGQRYSPLSCSSYLARWIGAQLSSGGTRATVLLCVLLRAASTDGTLLMCRALQLRKPDVSASTLKGNMQYRIQLLVKLLQQFPTEKKC